MRRALLVGWVLALGASNLLAAEGKKPRPQVDPNAIEVRYADGSVVKMVLLRDHIDVQTRFGKLSVPTDEIRRIEFGLRLPEDMARRIDNAVGKLGSMDFKEREAAHAELLRLRELAFPAVQRAARSGDQEIARRAREVLKELRDKIPADKLRLREHDFLQTSEFPIVGQIQADSLKARTAYFGDVQLQLSEMRTMRWLAHGSEIEVVVDASKYGLVQETWLDTGIEVEAEMGLGITAGGTVDLYPIGAEIGRYLVDPAGSMQWSQGRAGPYPNGALLGRVGETGKVFLVGTKYEGAATESGKLYFRVVASPWQNAPSGEYKVKISTDAR